MKRYSLLLLSETITKEIFNLAIGFYNLKLYRRLFFCFLFIGFLLPKTTIANDTITLLDNTDYYSLNLASEDTIDFDSNQERLIYLKNNSSTEKWSLNCNSWGIVKIDMGNDSILKGGWHTPYDQSNFIFARALDRGPTISLFLEKRKIYPLKISLNSPVLSGFPSNYNCSLVPSNTVGKLSSLNTIVTGALVFILIIFAIYNLFLFFLTKDENFIRYSITHLLFTLLWFNSIGITLYLFEFELSYLRVLDSIFATLFMGSYYWFTRGYLNTKKTDIKIDILLKYFQYLLFIISIIFLLLALSKVSNLDYILSYAIVNVLSPLGIIFIVMVIIRAILRKDKLIIYFSFAMLTFVLTVVIMNLNDANVNSKNIFVFNSVLFGAVLEAIFFSLGLAAKIKMSETEKIIVQKELIDKHIENQKIKDQFSKELEQKVEVRTLELNQKNNYIELALKEKELLIKEVHHRVKNNLQLMYSFMSLQSNRSENKLVKDAISESKERVRVLSMIHNSLSLSENSEEININDYIPDIANHLSRLSGQKKMNVICNIEPYLLPIKKAVSLGLIVNEIITNSIKYAEVSSVEKHIYINAIVYQGKIELDIYDDGIKHDSSGIEINSLGQLIIQDLTKQLKAKLEVNENFRYKIVIPIQ